MLGQREESEGVGTRSENGTVVWTAQPIFLVPTLTYHLLSL